MKLFKDEINNYYEVIELRNEWNFMINPGCFRNEYLYLYLYLDSKSNYYFHFVFFHFIKKTKGYFALLHSVVNKITVIFILLCLSNHSDLLGRSLVFW